MYIFIYMLCFHCILDILIILCLFGYIYFIFPLFMSQVQLFSFYVRVKQTFFTLQNTNNK